MKPKTQRIIRAYIRHELGTWPEGVPVAEWIDTDIFPLAVDDNAKLQALLNRIRAMRELFVGMANGPFLLVLKASNPESFIKYADQHPSHNVHITFDAEGNRNIVETGAPVQATIRPVDEPEAYSLFFGLPAVLRDHILIDENRGIRLAPGLKRRFFSDITIYRRLADRDVLYRLTYEPQEVRRSAIARNDEPPALEFPNVPNGVD